MDGALEGVRVIDSTQMVAMPTAMHIMADMGAEVVKVDSHTIYVGAMGGTFPENDPGEQHWNRDGSFNTLQRSKLAITLDLKQSEAVQAFKDLVKVTDVLVENNRAGAMDRLGLGYEDLREIKPDLIYLSNTGFGHTGPWKSYAGIGRMFELTCGLSQFAGYPDEGPRRIGTSFFDQHVGWMAVFAIMAALHHRNQTGEGQWIDFAMYQVGVSTMSDALLDYISNGRSGQPMGNRHPYIAPHGVYPCKGDDKWIGISTETEDQWKALVESMGNPAWAQDDKFSDLFSRLKNQDELDAFIGEWTKEYDHIELMNTLQKARIPAMAVMNNKEFLLDPQIQSRGFFERVSHPPETNVGTRLYFGRSWKMSKSPAYIRRSAPTFGQHNEDILGSLLGISEAEIAKLYETGVLGKEPVTPGSPKPADFDSQIEKGVLVGYDPDYKKNLGIE